MPENENRTMDEEMKMEGSDMMQERIYHNKILDTLQNCEETCEHMITHLLRNQDMQQRAKQLELLRDCSDICTLTSKYIARDSSSSKYAADLCAYICTICGNECLRFGDAESQRCGKICHDCARECKAFTQM